MTTTTDTTTTPLFSEYTTRLLLTGPVGLHNPPRDPATTAELAQTWGKFGERCGATWTKHARWLRQAAAERSIQPRFSGKFFAEALSGGR